jgi:hypothetical protein
MENVDRNFNQNDENTIKSPIFEQMKRIPQDPQTSKKIEELKNENNILLLKKSLL